MRAQSFTFSLLLVVAALVLLPMTARASGDLGMVREAGDCTGTSCTVTITDISYDCVQETVDADGGWWVAGGADGIYLEYSIDGQLQQSEHKSGVDGPWDFSDDYAANCSSHTFKVQGYPKVGSTICWTHGCSASSSFPSLPRASVDCEESAHPQYQCTGTASGGEPLYTAEWKEGSYGWVDAYPTDPSYGPWSRSFICKSTTAIRFRVTDSCGCLSNQATDFCGPFDP